MASIVSAERSFSVVIVIRLTVVIVVIVSAIVRSVSIMLISWFVSSGSCEVSVSTSAVCAQLELQRIFAQDRVQQVAVSSFVTSYLCISAIFAEGLTSFQVSKLTYLVINLV